MAHPTNYPSHPAIVDVSIPNTAKSITSIEATSFGFFLLRGHHHLGDASSPLRFDRIV